jgi:hypothetical protein
MSVGEMKPSTKQTCSGLLWWLAAEMRCIAEYADTESHGFHPRDAFAPLAAEKDEQGQPVFKSANDQSDRGQGSWLIVPDCEGPEEFSNQSPTSKNQPN